MLYVCAIILGSKRISPAGLEHFYFVDKIHWTLSVLHHNFGREEEIFGLGYGL